MEGLIVIAVSVSPDDEPCFVESVGCVLLVSWTPLASAILPSLFHGVPELCLLFDCGSSPAFAPIGCWMKFL